MTERQSNHVVMYHTLDDYLKGISEKLEKVPVYGSVKARYDAYLSEIEESARLQVTFTKGKSAAKSAADERLDKASESVRSVLQAKALSTGDAELLEKTKAFKREVPKLKHSERVRRAEILYQDALARREYISQFSENDILKELETAISAATDTAKGLNHGTASRKTVKKSLGGLIKAMNSLITVDLKAIFLSYWKTDPKLYTGFNDARKVRASAAKREKNTDTTADQAQPSVENTAPAHVLPAVIPAQEKPSTTTPSAPVPTPLTMHVPAQPSSDGMQAAR